MKILLCIKQVCDSADTIAPAESGTWLHYGDSTVFRMNRYDEYALEEALRIKDQDGHAVLDVLSVGPARVEATIRRALGMGAHHGIHILLEEEHCYIPPFERACLIAEVSRTRNYDLILTGVMAEDDMEGQVGGLLAEMLGYACATSVIHEEVNRGSGSVLVEREIEGGARECLTLKLPAVLSIQSGINIPRYPTLSHMLKARSTDLERIDASLLRSPSTRQRLESFTTAEMARTGEIIEGTPAQKACTLLDIIHQRALMERRVRS